MAMLLCLLLWLAQQPAQPSKTPQKTTPTTAASGVVKPSAPLARTSVPVQQGDQAAKTPRFTEPERANDKLQINRWTRDQYIALGETLGTIAGVVGTLWIIVITVGANRRALAATRHALILNERALQLAHRAWLVVGDLGDPEGPPVVFDRPPVILQIPFRNRGDVPALNVRAAVAVIRQADTPTTEQIISRMPPSNERTVVGPDDSREMKLPVNALTQTDKSDLTAGKWRFFLVGRLVYDDIFGSDHVTQFCFVFEPEAQHFRDAGQNLAIMT